MMVIFWPCPSTKVCRFIGNWPGKVTRIWYSPMGTCRLPLPSDSLTFWVDPSPTGMSDRAFASPSTRILPVLMGSGSAAAAVGVSERTLRDRMSEIPRVYFGRRVVIPVRELRDWLGHQAQRESERDEAIAREILAKLRD